jgi:hypothetical protein
MPIEITDLSQLDSDTIAQKLKLLAALLEGSFPSLDLTPGGVLYEAMLRPAGVLHTLKQAEFARMAAAGSLQEIAANPDLADETLVSRVMSNYLIQRRSGSAATGQLVLTLSSNDVEFIPSSTVFTANGIEFRPLVSFTAVPTAGLVRTEQDRLITESGEVYNVVIDVQATVVGTAGNVSKGTRFSTTAQIQGLIDIAAIGDFLGGEDADSNQDLIGRLQEGIGGSLSSRAALESAVKAAFPGVVDVSVIGAGDSEMQRDSHSTLAVKSLGRADVYVRTRQHPLQVALSKTAHLQDATTKTWSMSFTRDEQPGFYRVESVRRPGAAAVGTLEVTSEIRGVDPTPVAGLDRVPLMTVTEAAYTRYQTCSLTFEDPTSTEDTVGDEATFEVTVSVMPTIATLNDWLCDRSRQPWGGDYLVKAPLPCFVSVDLTIVRGLGDPEPDTAVIRQAVADAVNAVDFSVGRLNAAAITSVVTPLIGRRSRIRLPLDLRGVLRLPDGSQYGLFGPHELTVPDRPADMCSNRTVAFYLDPARVTVSVVGSDSLPV